MSVTDRRRLERSQEPSEFGLVSPRDFQPDEASPRIDLATNSTEVGTSVVDESMITSAADRAFDKRRCCLRKIIAGQLGDRRDRIVRNVVSRKTTNAGS